jgi:hypothetical protein
MSDTIKIQFLKRVWLGTYLAEKGDVLTVNNDEKALHWIRDEMAMKYVAPKPVEVAVAPHVEAAPPVAVAEPVKVAPKPKK